jgi:MFS family permease/cytochrome c2
VTINADARADRPVFLEGWRAVFLIAAAYVYFLIFAQFGFLHRLAQAGIADATLKPVMAAMAIGGIAASLVSARANSSTAARRLRFALVGCATAAGCTLLPLSPLAFGVDAFLIGASLGTLTVTLVANLSIWIGGRNPLLRVGIGTGLGYWICNIPAIFTAGSKAAAVVAIAACGLGLLASSESRGENSFGPPTREVIPLPFPLLLVWLTALIWFDSAAFFILQNAPTLQSGAWTSAADLWRTGAFHFLAALLSVWIVMRRGAAAALLVAFGCLAAACLLLLNTASGLLAAILYPVGVSLYSVVLVAYAALLIPAAGAADRARRAGWLYAIAGWTGSAMGIGMAQHLHRVPVWFIAIAAAVFLVPLLVRYGRNYRREVRAVGGVLIAALALEYLLSPRLPSAAMNLSPAQRGRRVYIAEGCINCHSQYVRPHSHDVEMWGPSEDLETIRREHPPLIGNRREGPDLSQVGARRSPLWLRIHLIDPRATSPGSPMPSYSYLFRDDRGNELLAYLESLRTPTSVQHILQEAAAWHPSPGAGGHSAAGATLFRDYCATCHDADGPIRQRWGADFQHLPPILDGAAIRKYSQGGNPQQLISHLARVIKFGIPGTDMPGHEYMPDRQVQALAAWLAHKPPG